VGNVVSVKVGPCNGGPQSLPRHLKGERIEHDLPEAEKHSRNTIRTCARLAKI
jgi:hypothetical protein